MAFLDTLEPVAQRVGYGQLGLRGSLGYDGQRVCVQGRTYDRSLSTHPPATLRFELGGRFEWFRCAVALNDDVFGRPARADFLVVADGRIVGAAPRVYAADPPAPLEVCLAGAQVLELIVDSDTWDSAHAVWLDPELHEQAPPVAMFTDALQRAEILQTGLRAGPSGRCIATVVSSGYTRLLDDLLSSIEANANCSDATLLVFSMNGDAECARVIAAHGAIAVPCRLLGRVNQTIKSVLYYVANVADARAFLCLDADTLVLGDLNPLFSALDAYPRGSIAVCQDAYLGAGPLEEHLFRHYRGAPGDLRRLLGMVRDEGRYPLAINDGVFAGSRAALLGLDHWLRRIPHAVTWVDQYADHGWRNQFVLNLALAHLGCGVQLDSTYNVQLHVSDLDWVATNGAINAFWRGRPASVLHFCGWGRDKYPEWRERVVSEARRA
jgi:hypothetical protein